MSFRRTTLAAASALMLALGATYAAPAFAADPQPTMVEKTLTAVAIVESTDPTTREVLLSGPDGRLLTVVAGPEVRNFNQIQAGDHLVLTFRKAVAVQLAPADKTLPQPVGVVGATRAARGALPAGSGFMAMSVQVTIDSIDRRAHTVTFTDPQGVTHIVELHNPAMIHFADKLKKGDNVQINYLQSVSIKLRPDPNA